MTKDTAMRRNPLIVCVVALALTAGAARPADTDDERVLKQAGVATDDAGLLGFFRTSGPSEDDIRALVRQLGDDSFEAREKASARLAALGPPAEPFLREALKSADAEIARRAEECLKHIGGGTPAAVVSAAARLIARRKPAGAAEALLAYVPRAAGQTSDEDVRAALAAVAVRDGKADPALVKALEDKSAARRAAAAVALARGGADRETMNRVRQLLHDAEPSVRLQTAFALAALQEKEAVPVLIDLLAVLPRGRHAPIEELLYRLAEDKAPEGLAGNDEAARKKYRDAWAEWWKANGDKADLAKLAGAGKFLGYTMLVMLDAGRVLEVDADGKTRWQIDGLEFPLDAQRLPGDRVLVAEYEGNRVTERDRKGNVLWQKRISQPLAAQRLPNGNTFIATRTELLEVDREGKQVFARQRTADLIMKAQKLDKGDIGLVVTGAAQGAEYVRLDASGQQVAAFPVDVRTSGGRIEVLPNGHVLAPLKDQNKVVEYDATGKKVWEAEFPEPVAAVRMPNGHTVVTSLNDRRAAELDGAGKQVWEYKADGRVTRAWRR